MAPQQQPQGNADNSMAMVWMSILFLIVVALIWSTYKAQIISAIFQLKLWQISIIKMFTSSLDKVEQFIKTANFKELKFEQVDRVCGAVGMYVRYPVGAILGVMGIYLIFRSSSFRYTATYSMKRLAQAELKNWPQIAPVIPLDLVNQDIDKGKWSMSQTPMQFAKKYRLLIEERKAIAEGMLQRDYRPTVTVNKGAAARVFAMQLGKPWRGVENLTMPQKALFAAFAAKANRDDKTARKLLEQIAGSTSNGRLDFTGTEKLLARYCKEKNVQQVINAHGYVLSVMASMLELARTDGVMASADFLWLKPVDRPLWYMLNNIGRRTAFPEVGGPMSHWLCEKEMGKKIMVPMIDEAVISLEKAITEMIYVPDEE